jgi:hypothetical protein
MLPRPARVLTFALLLTLCAPATRMAAWLLDPASATDFVSGRQGPQARGSNRVSSPASATAVDARAALASGGGPVVRPRGPRDVWATMRPVRVIRRLTAPPSAPAPGSTRLRC